MRADDIYTFSEKLIEYKNKHFKESYKIRFVVFRVGSKKNVVGWFDEDVFLRSFDEFVREDPFVAGVSYTLLPNEFVIETDVEGQIINRSFYKLVIDELERRKWKYYMVYSGGKSVHFHVLINPKTYNNDINKLRQVKQKIYEDLKKTIPNIDPFGFKEHPYRIPGSKHPETRKLSEILIDLHDYYKNVPHSFEKLENDISINIDDKQKHINPKSLILINTNNTRNVMREGQYKNILYNLYQDLLNLQITDGRDRVLLMIYTIANTLGIDTEQFSRDLQNWATKNDWKEYRWKRWIDYYKEKRYTSTWGKNWRWAIKNFINSKDIETESYNTIMGVLEPYLSKLKINIPKNDN